MSMRWEDERYVRVYTRDTVTWLMLSFKAKALLVLLLRKADRAGLIHLGPYGKKAVGVVVGHPHEEGLEEAVGELEAGGVVIVSGADLVFPKFIEAQETPQSDKQRSRESRAKARDIAKAGEVVAKPEASQNVSPPTRNVSQASRNVSPPSRDVTPRHAASRGVTPCRAVPSRTEEEGASAPLPAAAPQAPSPEPAGQRTPPAETLQELWNAHPGLPRWREMPEPRRKAALARLRERPMDGPEGWRTVVERIAASAFCRGSNDRNWRADPDFLLRPGTAAKVLEGKYDGRGPDTPFQRNLPTGGDVPRF